MSDFFARLDARIDADSANPEGDAFRSHGFEVEHTGGGCTTWATNVDETRFFWVTDLSGSDFVRSAFDDAWLFGGYWNNGDDWAQGCINPVEVGVGRYDLVPILATLDAFRNDLGLCESDSGTEWLVRDISDRSQSDKCPVVAVIQWTTDPDPAREGMRFLQVVVDDAIIGETARLADALDMVRASRGIPAFVRP